MFLASLSNASKLTMTKTFCSQSMLQQCCRKVDPCSVFWYSNTRYHRFTKLPCCFEVLSLSSIVICLFTLQLKWCYLRPQGIHSVQEHKCIPAYASLLRWQLSPLNDDAIWCRSQLISCCFMWRYIMVLWLSLHCCAQWTAYVPSSSTTLRWSGHHCRHNRVLDVLTLTAYDGCWLRQPGHKRSSVDGEICCRSQLINTYKPCDRWSTPFQCMLIQMC